MTERRDWLRDNKPPGGFRIRTRGSQCGRTSPKLLYGDAGVPSELGFVWVAKEQSRRVVSNAPPALRGPLAQHEASRRRQGKNVGERQPLA